MLALSLMLFYPATSNSYSCPPVNAQVQRIPKLTDQQVSILVGLYVNPDWLKQQSMDQTLVYGVVKPSDKVPAGVEDDSFLVSANDAESISLFLKTTSKRVIIQYSDQEKMRTTTVSLSRLVHQEYRTKAQQRQAKKYLDTLRTE